MIDPIRLTFEVDCPVEHAFEVWTARIAQWWPNDHTVSAEEDLTVVLEGRRGGRIFERRTNGVEHDWGEITLWEPPTRLGYTWHLNRDRSDATEVEVRFIAGADASTKVEIEHRGWERLGADAERWRDRNQGGWATLVPHYVAVAALPSGIRRTGEVERVRQRNHSGKEDAMRTDDGLLVVGAAEGLAGPDDIVVKVRASQTGGRWGVAVVSGVPGEGGRTHIHRDEPEGFFVLQGEIELLGLSSRTPIGPGTFVLVPPDTEHGLRIVGTGEARWLAIWPAALDGLVEELLTLDPDDAAGAADVRRRHRMEPGRDRRDDP